MAKKRSFLGFLASLFIVFFSVNAFAEGYVCDETKRYTSCNANYYLNGTSAGNACVACDSGYTKEADSSVGAANCTQACTVNCTKQSCPNNATCTHGTQTATGTRNQTQAAGVCSATAPQCSISISCNASYYKTSSDTCQACDIGKYSVAGATSCSSCTNKPSNSHYTGNATSNSCAWECDSGWHKNAAGTACEKDSSSVTCECGKYIAKGATTCSTTCPANKWCAGGTFTIAASGAAADTGISGSCSGTYPYADTGSCSQNSCYKNDTKYGTRQNGTNETGCAQHTWTDCAVNSCTYRTYYNGTTTSCTAAPCTNERGNCISASTNYYLDNGTAKDCFAYNPNYPSSAGGNITSGSCYGPSIAVGEVKEPTMPTGCAARTLTDCTPEACSYEKYANGTNKTTCNPASCTKGQTCTSASANYYLDSGTAKKCSEFSSTYTQSDGGSITSAYCYKEISKTGTTSNAETPSGCYSVSAYGNCPTGTPSTCTYKDYYSATDTTCTPTNCVKPVQTVTANTGNYVSGTTCPACDASYPLSPQGNSYAASSCYRNCTTADISNSKTVGGTVTKGGTVSCYATSCADGYFVSGSGCAKLPTGGIKCADGSTGLCCDTGYTKTSDTTCTPNEYNVTYSCGSGTGTAPTANKATYKASYTPKDNTCSRNYYNFAGWLVSGTTTTKTAGASFTWEYTEAKTFTAQWTVKDCPAGQYLENGACQSCPSGYPNSVDHNTGNKTSCYSNTKSRAWTGAQNNISTPDGCSAVTEWNACSRPACDYVAYSNAAGTGDGTIKSGCSTNAESCNKSIKTVTAKQNHYVSGITCPACGVNSYTTAGNSATTCTCTSPTPAGYSANGKRDGATTSTSGCSAVSYNISYVLNEGIQATSGVPTSYTYGVGATINGTPTRTNYTFEGWCTDAALTSCAKTQTIATNATGDKTFYAKWSKTLTACQIGKYWNGTSHVTCPSGKYCPGPSVIATSWIGETGCATNCPTDSKGGTVKSAAGSSAKSACYVDRKEVSVANGFADQMCFVTVATDVYDRACEITVTSCNVGHYREQVNSTSCAVVNNGYYSADKELARHACGDLNGAATNVTTQTNTPGVSTACYNPCSNIAIDNGTRVPVRTQEFFNGTNIPACTYTTQCNTGYQASGVTCIPKILTITLNQNGGTTTGASTIYLKYNTGWFSDSAATQQITSVVIPIKSDSEGFSGYLSTNNDMVVAETGVLTTNYTVFSANATVTADWTPRTPITCDAGNYYTGTGAACTRCPAGSYCPGVATYQEVGSARGINTCQSLGGTYTHSTDAAGATVISSDPGASAATDCYATNLAYKSATNNADGYQTCYYNAATRVYSDNCKNIKVTRCSGGHYRISADAGDCAEVGVGYYSPKDALGRTACPHLASNIGVKTFSTTSTEVTQCYRGNIWYVPSGGHSAHRRSCFHIDAATSANPDTGYSYNCDVSVIVTCDGGYYDDGAYRNANNERDCVAITSLSPYYSPFQSFFTNEPLQPDQERPGSSTKRLSCPLSKAVANGTEQRRIFQNTWVASDYAVCKYTQADCDAGYRAVADGNEMKCDTCPKDHFCTGGNTIAQTCPIDTVSGQAGMADAGATTMEDCYVEHNSYPGFDNGKAKARCTYSGVTRDYTICKVTALTCVAGYYHNGNFDNPKCVKVGYGFYSPEDDMNRYSCEVGQTTDSDASGSKEDCKSCPAGSICDPSSPDEPKTCEDLTGGVYPNSDAGASRIDQCWNDKCPLVANAATMKGRNYQNGVSTCDVDHCKAGYTYNATTKSCGMCPTGMFCGGGGDDDACPADQNCGEPKSCASLGDGSWAYSEIGANSPANCYRKCEQYPLVGGIAVPVRDIEFYATECEYKGFDNVGNPCEIEDGKCMTSSCKPSYEMVNGKCMACNRDHALSYKDTGNCMVEACEPGWHPYGQQCEADTIECTAPNASSAEQRWDYAKNSFDICLITECDEGFHISSNACVSDIQECKVEHGIGEREWNHTTNTWGECVATSCDPGWTNDPYESNEPTKQCGHCKNKFGVRGALAASSYSSGCTISSCMYQGELYNLENNECNPICDVDGYSDETGSMIWDESTHKCKRECNPGYVMW